MAVVSDERKWMFIHIPKSGGTSISRFMWPHLGPDDFAIEAPPDPSVFPARYGIEKHAKACKYLGWMRDTGRDWDSFTSFAVVRDPLRRPQSVFVEIRRQIGLMRQFIEAAPSSLSPWWEPPVSTLPYPASLSAAVSWMDEFERLGDVNDFVLSGMYGPDGPQKITHSQRSYVSMGDDIIVKHLLSLKSVPEGVPSLLGLPGTVNHVNRGGYKVVALTHEASVRVSEMYAADLSLFEKVSTKEQTWTAGL